MNVDEYNEGLNNSKHKVRPATPQEQAEFDKKYPQFKAIQLIKDIYSENEFIDAISSYGIVKGDFVWESEEKNKVIFKENPNGKFKCVNGKYEVV